MATSEAHGPVDFVLLEFSGDRLTGGAAQALLDLVDRGIVTVYDVLVVGKEDDGTSYSLDLAGSQDRLGDFADLGWARSGLLTEEDLEAAADAMAPGTLAVLIVFENTWAIPFITAARKSGGEVIASARIPAPDLMEALDALDARDDGVDHGSRQPVAATPSGG
jgi:Family of unknown function (DUF6325)